MVALVGRAAAPGNPAALLLTQALVVVVIGDLLLVGLLDLLPLAAAGFLATGLAVATALLASAERTGCCVRAGAWRGCCSRVSASPRRCGTPT